MILCIYSNMEVKTTNALEMDRARIRTLGATLSTTLTLILASIAIIQFSQTYKKKNTLQSLIFVLPGTLLLVLALLFNSYTIRFMKIHPTRNYRSLIIFPIGLQIINIIFLIYALYIVFKRVKYLKNQMFKL